MCGEDGLLEPMAQAGPQEVRSKATGQAQDLVAIDISAFEQSATSSQTPGRNGNGYATVVADTLPSSLPPEPSSPVMRHRIDFGLASLNPLPGLKNAANNLSEGLKPLSGARDMTVSGLSPLFGLLGKSSSRQLSRRNFKLSFPELEGDDAVAWVTRTEDTAGTLLKWCRTGWLSYTPKRIVHKFWVESESLRWNSHKKGAKGSVGRIPLASIISVTAFVLDVDGAPEDIDPEDMHKSGQSQRSTFSSARRNKFKSWVAGGGSMLFGLRPDFEFEIFYRREDSKQKHEKLHLRARSRRELKLWVTGLQQLLLNRMQSARNMNIDAMSRDLFRQADTNDDGKLEWFEVRKVLESLGVSNMHLTEWNRHVFFKKYDKDGDGEIHEDEFVSLYRDLMTRKVLRRYFDEYASEETFADIIENIDNSVEDTIGNCRLLTTTQLCRFFREVQAEKDADPATVKEVLDNIRKLPGAEYAVHASMCAITEIGLSIFMCSDFNRLIDPDKATLHQDMTQPLSRYFINSSHNTYLENRQFGGKASVSQYIDVLRRGCRCVEIDCWDGSDGDPVVTHGYASRPLIRFKDVIRACRDHAFEHSEFPLIISIEMRCGPEQKGRCGKIMEQVLGDMLLRMPASGLENAALCSPESARRKIIIKAKPVGLGEEETDSEDDEGDSKTADSISQDKSPETQAALERMSPSNQVSPAIVRSYSQGSRPFFSSARTSGSEMNEGDFMTQDSSNVVVHVSTLGGTSSASNGTVFFNSEYSNQESCRDSTASPNPSPQRRAGKLKTSRSRSVPSNGTNSQHTEYTQRQSGFRTLIGKLSSSVGSRKSNKSKTTQRISKFVEGLVEYNKVIYLHAMKFQVNETRPLGEGRHPCNISSLKEAKMRTKLRKYGSSMNDYHENNLTRVYPAVWHSNFTPLVHWWHGTQLVALNYQNFGDVMLINEGMFRHQNGGFGYVLKPDTVRSARGQKLAADVNKNRMDLRIRVMSGHFLPKTAKTGTISPSVRVMIRGLDSDSVALETSVQQENGFDPCWENDRDMDFVVVNPDMAFLCFYVNDNPHKANQVTVAVAAYPVNMLREGVRWVPLWDMRHNDIENCGLLVRIRFARQPGTDGGILSEALTGIREGTQEGSTSMRENEPSCSECIQTPMASPNVGTFFPGAGDPLLKEDTCDLPTLDERGILCEVLNDDLVQAASRRCDLPLGSKLSL